MDTKVKKRHKAITALVAEKKIDSQEALISELEEQFGIKTNQVQISRDLKQLDIGKRRIDQKMVYELPAEGDIKREIIRLAITEVLCNESMIVVKTLGGLAPFVGDYIDAEKSLEVIGSIAGENVVLVIPKEVASIKETYKAVCIALHYKK